MTSLITLQEAKDFLNITTTTDDAELGLFTDAASQIWLARGLPGAGTPRDEFYDGGTTRIVLRYTPIVSVTAVSETIGAITYPLTEQPVDGGTAGAYAFTVDPFTGVMCRRMAGVAIPFADGTTNVHVTYSSGFATVPEDIKLAIKLLTRHMWQTQRGGSQRPGKGGNDDTPSVAFIWPNRVQEIADAYTGPVVA
jgi:hypothetical protein